jgi:hypothetical protein
MKLKTDMFAKSLKENSEIRSNMEAKAKLFFRPVSSFRMSIIIEKCSLRLVGDVDGISLLMSLFMRLGYCTKCAINYDSHVDDVCSMKLREFFFSLL